ncbi:hypothetical protein P154DRAFT_535442 [Amniculicola lignicola CBS 123094]|uniref:Uncharacterized protein n=1 Tax=Amniculicola lignicola CBS 123094 TaxID=1392246 RepID=A0A6A5WP82_9PLEO|nr:hypothetical protein P154DRAFT_535442 [Amniculicola lignicola CBS 123094]
MVSADTRGHGGVASCDRCRGRLAWDSRECSADATEIGEWSATVRSGSNASLCACSTPTAAGSTPHVNRRRICLSARSCPAGGWARLLGTLLPGHPGCSQPSTSPPRSATSPPTRMPALTIPSPAHTRPASPSGSSSPSQQSDRPRSRSRSPDRPPVSPITPTASIAQLAPLGPLGPLGPSERRTTNIVPPQDAAFRKQPPPVPISESDNPDAIALRSAISLLQLQREKSKRDLQTLQQLKAAAVSDPPAFARALEAQKAQKAQAPTAAVDMLTPTLSNASGLVLQPSDTSNGEQRNGAAPKLPAIPQPQNVVRCPPVNWAKYHVVGEPLDKMHEEQKQYPFATEPPRNPLGMKAPAHAVAAPYSPFSDGLSEPASRRASKKPPL